MEAPTRLRRSHCFLLSDRRDTVLWVFTLTAATLLPSGVCLPIPATWWRPMPLAIALTAVVFNLGNAYLNWRFLARLGDRFDPTGSLTRALSSAQLPFLVGFVINQHADYVLLRLANPARRATRSHGGIKPLCLVPQLLGRAGRVDRLGDSHLVTRRADVYILDRSEPCARALSHHRDYHRSLSPSDPAVIKPLIPFLPAAEVAKQQRSPQAATWAAWR